MGEDDMNVSVLSIDLDWDEMMTIGKSLALFRITCEEVEGKTTERWASIDMLEQRIAGLMREFESYS